MWWRAGVWMEGGKDCKSYFIALWTYAWTGKASDPSNPLRGSHLDQSLSRPSFAGLLLASVCLFICLFQALPLWGGPPGNLCDRLFSLPPPVVCKMLSWEKGLSLLLQHPSSLIFPWSMVHFAVSLLTNEEKIYTVDLFIYTVVRFPNFRPSFPISEDCGVQLV